MTSFTSGYVSSPPEEIETVYFSPSGGQLKSEANAIDDKITNNYLPLTLYKNR